jgi:hypothetical protein
LDVCFELPSDTSIKYIPRAFPERSIASLFECSVFDKMQFPNMSWMQIVEFDDAFDKLRVN